MNVLVVGKGKSGKAAFSLLKKQGVNVLFADEKIVNADKTESLKIDYDRLLHGLSFIVTSPGISLDLPFFKEVRKRKIKLVGELELGAVLCKGKIIAITGTNGKTTTVSLIHHLLGGLKQNVFLGGNIGIPICMFVEKTQPNDIVVLECSSYQLESVEKFKPHIAAILNVTEDHLTRHKTMKNYLKAK